MAEACAEAASAARRFQRKELEDFVSQRFKAFVKEPCGQCGQPASRRFAGSMPFVVKTMLDTFWCQDCGRLLCEAHRSQHACERHDARMARLTQLTPEQLRQQMEEEARRKLAAEEALKAAERARAVAAEERRLEMKGRRQLLAAKAGCVANFLQTAARDDQAGRPARVRDELLELYTSASRASLRLLNECEQPSVSGGLAEEDWQQVKDAYSRGVELLHQVVVVDGQELDLTNPWEAPAQAPA